MRRIINTMIIAVCSLLSVFAINQYFFSDATAYKNSIVNLIIFVIVFGCSLREKRRSADIQRSVLLFSILLSIALVLGNSIEQTTTLSLVIGSGSIFALSLLEIIGFLHLFYVVLMPFLRWVTARSENLARLSGTGGSDTKGGWFFSDKKRAILLVWAALFLCWLPVWLAYYPGIFSYDAPWQMLEIVGEVPYHNFHPILHTLFMELCFRVGWIFGGNAAALAVYSLAQMFLMSGILSYALWRLAVMRLHLGLRWIILIFFALNPVCAVFSFVLAKDVLAAGFFVLATVSLVDMIRDRDAFFRTPKKSLQLAAFLLLLCLFRNNVVVALIFALIFILIFPWYKEYRRKLLPVFGSVIIAAFLITGPLFSLLHINGTSKAEALSVPLQQVALATVNHGEEFSDAEQKAIEEVFQPNMAEEYNPRIADPVKSKLIVAEFDKDPGKYIGLWFELSKRYPADYINAAMNLNLAYWYPDTKQPDVYLNSTYIETYLHATFGGDRESKIPWLLNMDENLISNVGQQNVPVIGALYNIGMPIWFVFFCILFCFVKGRKEASLFLIPAVAIWLTFLLGPVANLRYMFPLILCSPIYLGVVLQFTPKRD